MKVPEQPNFLQNRYAAQLALPEIGIQGQQQLQSAKVLCVGLGGLAASALPYLVAAGIGSIGLMDGDQIALVNLHRQVLYRDDDVGMDKVSVTANYLSRMNPRLVIEQYPSFASATNITEVIQHYDYIVDASDNFATHLLLNDACWLAKKPLILAAVETYYGYCMSVLPQLNTPCLRCFLGHDIPVEQPSCTATGVLGTLPGLLGLCEATQVLKLILNLGQPLSGMMLWCDALNFTFKNYMLTSDPHCVLCANPDVTDLEQLPRPQLIRCSTMTTHTSNNDGVIEYTTLSQLMDENARICLIDVRNHVEHSMHNLGGICIPLNELQDQLQNLAGQPQHVLNQLSRDHLIIVYCQKGLRSQTAATALRTSGFTNVLSLSGGIAGCVTSP